MHINCTNIKAKQHIKVSSPILCMLSCITNEMNNDVKITVVFVQHGMLLKS